MATRSDYATRTRPVLLSDFDVTLALNPVTSDLSRLTNTSAAAQAVRLTLLTIAGEWPFEPDNGTAVNKSLFDLSDAVSVQALESSILLALRNRCSAYARVESVTARARSSDSRFVDVHVAYGLVAEPSVTDVARIVVRSVR